MAFSQYGGPGDWESFVSFATYGVVVCVLALWICRKDDDSFKKFAVPFIICPFLGGMVIAFNGFLTMGMATSALISLALTVFLGNLRLRSCLLLAGASAAALAASYYVAIWLDAEIVQNIAP